MKSSSLTMLIITTFIGFFISGSLSNPHGFLNINCGASTNRTDAAGRDWISDSPFIKSRNVSYLSQFNDTYFPYRSFAYFTNVAAKKYCYLLPVKPSTVYLVRARFSNWAIQSAIPLAMVFALLIDGIRWSTVDISDLQSGYNRYHDIILAAKTDSLSLCLARNSETETSTYVFISTIELRQLKSQMYNSFDLHNNALVLLTRTNFGSYEETVYEYPDDPFDRIWHPYSSSSMKNISTGLSVGKNLLNQPPLIVLQTAITTQRVTEMKITDALGYVNKAGSYYFALYFCNINHTSLSRNRTFQVYINNYRITDWLRFTSFLQCWDVYQNLVLTKTGNIDLTLSPGEGSDMGPFINAAEIYQMIDIQNMTHWGDVLAIRKIANTTNVPDDWAGGDPCLPVGFSCTGIICNEENPRRVIILNLTNMGIMGNIPSSIANLTALTQLLLGSNKLSGSIPNLSSLKNLTTLQLQNNQLTGAIPKSFEKLPMLNQLFLQNNKFHGAFPPGLIKPGLNLQYDGIAPQSNFQAAAPQSNFPTGRKNHKLKSWITGLLVGCSIQLIVLISATFIWRHKHRQRGLTTNGPIMQPPVQNLRADEEEINEYYRVAVEYTEEDIKAATDNYSTVIGKGGFGSVFYGRLSGHDVAIKILSTNSNQGQREFRNEVALLSRIYHKNLVNLIGYCRQHIEALVYEYMHSGTLKDHLYGRAKLENPLDWHTRLNIALQAAEGLLYLHQGCNPPIIHRDIKCTNILLDRRMSAKVADFGLAKLLDNSQSNIETIVKGTLGYLDPEYYGTSTLNEKSDVYSFGVVLLEIISGQPPSENIVELARKLLSCGKLVELMDSSLGGQYRLTTAWKVAEVAYTCVEPKSINRPKMSMVVKELEEALALEFEDSNQYIHISDASFHESDMPKVR